MTLKLTLICFFTVAGRMQKGKAGFREGFPVPLLQVVEEKTLTPHERDFPSQTLHRNTET